MADQITQVFQNVQKKLMNAAQRRLTAQLENVMSALHDYVRDEQNFGDMTGNWINSFGVALYRDGSLVAIANMSNEEDAPIRTTLIDGDWFKKGQTRFDKSVQQKTFEIDGKKYKGAADQVFYNEEVLDWLSSTWTKKDGFSIRVITVTEYHKKEARSALLRLGDEMENKGGYIWHFNM